MQMLLVGSELKTMYGLNEGIKNEESEQGVGELLE
jgi:hypothetical protein